jgi:hypothetical protein
MSKTYVYDVVSNPEDYLLSAEKSVWTEPQPEFLVRRYGREICNSWTQRQLSLFEDFELVCDMMASPSEQMELPFLSKLTK